MKDLPSLLRAIATGDRQSATKSLDATPSLVTARLARPDELFIEQCHAQLYEGDTALHAAAFAYDVQLAQELIARGADISARNRRGAQPLHAATNGVPGSTNWNPTAQQAIIQFLIEAGADPNATAAGGATPLHRAIRNRCSAAVDQLLRAGANPHLPNDHGSTPSDLSHLTTGRGGTGSDEAKAEQQIIIALLTKATT